MSEAVKPLSALTGLRWIAAFAVFIHHVEGKFAMERHNWSLGSLAVSFFFVLSGFILTYVYHSRMTGQKGQIRKFMFTRFARIWPLHVVCLMFFIGCFINVRTLFDSSQNSQIFLSNLALLQSWVPDSKWVFSFNGVSWSISTEMFFYLMFPLFLVGGQRRFWYKYAGILGFVALAILGLSQLETLSAFSSWDFSRIGHVNPLLRLPEFCTGMAVGYVHLNLKDSARVRNVWADTVKEVSCFALIFGWSYFLYRVGFVAAIRGSDFGGVTMASFARVTCCLWTFALTIFVFSRSQGYISRLMGSRPMVFLGEISFAFYMVHLIVILVAKRYFWADTVLNPYVFVGCVFLVAVGLSIGLYKLVEMPGKAALLALYELDFRSFISIAPNEIRKFGTSGLAWLAVFLIVLPTTAMISSPEKVALRGIHAKIVRQSPSYQKNVEFGGKIMLLGCRSVPRGNGVELQMVWKKRAEVQRFRVIHVMDKDGNVVAHGPRSGDPFASAPVGVPFLDRVVVQEKFIDGASAIGVAFHGRGIGMLKADRGQRTHNNRRLTVVNELQFTQVAKARQERIGVVAGKDRGKIR